MYSNSLFSPDICPQQLEYWLEPWFSLSDPKPPIPKMPEHCYGHLVSARDKYKQSERIG